jgi:hypothetical protein
MNALQLISKIKLKVKDYLASFSKSLLTIFIISFIGDIVPRCQLPIREIYLAYQARAPEYEYTKVGALLSIC